MTIEKIITENGVILAPDGRLDTITSDKLGKAIEAIDAAAAITLDFDKVEYISSFGLRQVVVGAKKAKELGAEFSVINVNRDVMNIFSITGFDSKLTITGK